MKLGLTRDELKELATQLWELIQERQIQIEEETTEDDDPDEVKRRIINMGYQSGILVGMDMIVANNRRIEEQLTALGVLPKD